MPEELRQDTGQDVAVEEKNGSAEEGGKTKINESEFRKLMSSDRPKLESMMKEAGLSPEEWITQNVVPDSSEDPQYQGQKNEPVAEEQKQEPTNDEPVEPEVEKETVVEEQAEKRFKTFGEFLKEAREAGFYVKDMAQFLETAKNKDKALKTFKEEAQTFRQKLEAIENEKKSLEESLAQMKKGSQVSIAPSPSPQFSGPVKPGQKLEIGGDIEAPNIDYLEADDSKALSNYISESKKREQKAVSQHERIVKELTSQYESKLSANEKRVQELERQFNETKSQIAQQRESEERMKVRERAFEAANKFLRDNKDYQMSKPIDDVSKEYDRIYSEIFYLQQSNPALQNRDLIKDYLDGDAAVQGLFAQRDINIDDNVKTYMLLAGLEQDAVKHQLFDDLKRPDLTKALILRKANEGVLQQEIVNAQMKGFDEAQSVVKAVKGGARDLRPSETTNASTTQSFKPMSQEDLLIQMQSMKKIGDAQKHAAKAAELAPHLQFYGLETIKK